VDVVIIYCSLAISNSYVLCMNGRIEIVKLFLNDNRIDINKASNDGETPFYIACEKGYYNM